MNSKKGLFIESSPVTSVHVSAVLHYNSCQVGSMPHWFLSILKQGKNLNEGPVDDSSTIAGAYNVSIGDYVILSFSFSKDQHFIFLKEK